MRSAQFELISLSLAFAISLSLPRVLGILLSLQMSNVAVPFATMISSAVLISSFGLAFAEYGPVSGVMITLLGVLILGTLDNAMTLLSVSAYYQQIALGILLLLAVGLDQLRVGNLGRLLRSKY